MALSSSFSREDLIRVATSGPESAFDRIANLAAAMLAAPVAMVTFVDETTQRVKARVGTDFCGGPKDNAFCKYVVDDPTGSVMVVEDLRRDARFAGHRLVTHGGFRFYAGAPLLSAEGRAIGTLCVLGFESRTAVTSAQRENLANLAALVIDELTLRAQHRASEEARRLMGLAEAVAGVGHWRYVIAEDHVFWSDEVYRIHGVTPGSYNPNLTGGIDFYLPEDRIKVVKALESAIHDKTGFEFRLQIRRADGAVRTVMSKAVCEFDEAGQVSAIFGVFKDLTERLADLDAMQQARDEAETAMTAHASFLANMSHELRTPMSSIIGYAELLCGALPHRSDQFAQAEMIGTAGRNLLTMIDDILDLAKLDNGKMPIRARSFSPHVLAEETVDFLQLEANRRGIALRLVSAARPSSPLIGDPDRLRQVLMNLVGNAIKFTLAGSVTLEVALSARDTTASVRFEIADTGIGIPPEKIATLFDRFSQVKQGGMRDPGGAGLGLAISRSLVDAMGGTIAVSSIPGEGSVFTVALTLPIDLRQPGDATVSHPGPVDVSEPLATDERRILVAEDLAINRELIRVMLAPLGCNVDFAHDGEACLRQVQQQDYSLVLMDVRMPRLDGYAATRAIHALGGRFRELPVIALTASVMPEDIARCRDAGMVDHIEKPLVMRRLHATVAAWLGA